MSLEDIWRDVLYTINDIDVVKEACKNNKVADKLCSQQSFWLEYFQKNNISMVNINYDNSCDWIEEFIFVKIKSKEVNNLIRCLYKRNNCIYGLYYWVDIESNYNFLSLTDGLKNCILNEYLVKNNCKRVRITVCFNGEYWILSYDDTIMFRLILSDMKRYIFQLLYQNYIIYPIEQLI